jgi:alkylation response protein AidB-like acyl-CoA dehydrogenase
MRTHAFDHRYSDHEFDEDQLDLQAAARDFLRRESSTEALRAAGSGVDVARFDGLRDLGMLEMALPEAGVGMVELVAVAEVVGAALGGVPVAEIWATARLLAAVDDTDVPTEADGIDALAFEDLSGAQLIAGGAAARSIIGLIGDRLVRVRLAEPLPTAGNTAGIALGRWSATPGEFTELARGAEAVGLFANAVAQWRVITAALSAAAASTAIESAVEFANQRTTRGVVIGALQAISHPLADARVGVVAARNLARRAAWFLENEPASRPDLPVLAIVLASRSANRAAHVAVHVQGGQGVSLESDVTLAFTRAVQWPLVGGNPETLLADLGRSLVDHRNEGP